MEKFKLELDYIFNEHNLQNILYNFHRREEKVFSMSNHQLAVEGFDVLDGSDMFQWTDCQTLVTTSFETQSINVYDLSYEDKKIKHQLRRSILYEKAFKIGCMIKIVMIDDSLYIHMFFGFEHGCYELDIIDLHNKTRNILIPFEEYNPHVRKDDLNIIMYKRNVRVCKNIYLIENNIYIVMSELYDGEITNFFISFTLNVEAGKSFEYTHFKFCGVYPDMSKFYYQSLIDSCTYFLPEKSNLFFDSKGIKNVLYGNDHTILCTNKAAYITKAKAKAPFPIPTTKVFIMSPSETKFIFVRDWCLCSLNLSTYEGHILNNFPTSGLVGYGLI
jgi:hypothetical protein